MKIVKRICVILVLCLAVVGAMSLLKKAPELNLSVDDVDYLERELGKSASTEASREGLSGVLMNVEGMPPIDGISVSNGSSTPPASFGIPSGSIQPHAELAPLSEAPSFAVSAEAPPFVPAASAAPIASPYAAPAQQIPQVPQSSSEAPAFIPAPIPSVQVIPPPQTPAPSEAAIPSPPTAQATIPQYSPYSPPPPIPAFEAPPPPIPESPPQAWNGPATEVINLLPSSAQFEPQGDSVVPGLPSIGKIDPSGETFRNETPTVALTPVKRLPVVPEPMAVSDETVSEVPLFTAMAALAEQNAGAVIPATGPAEKKIIPTQERYRQTSVRQDLVFASTTGPANDMEPVISFSQQKPVVKSMPVPTEAFRSEPEKVAEPEVIPFVESDALSKAPTASSPVLQADNRTAPVVPVKRETDLAQELRPTVTRFVKAQGILADSGDLIKMRNAFIQLSKLYELPELNDAERAFMRPVLDRLALAIIYSRSHHVLESAYTVKSGDTVESIAASLDISPALLMKINGLTGSRPLEPGTKLKVVVGRFDAKISVSRREITLILGGLYAGRFPVVPGERIADLRGEFYVNSKTGVLHERTLTLNNGITIRGVDHPQPGSALATTVRLTEKDAGELFDILTEQSIIVFED